MVPAFVRMGDIHLVGDDIREIWSEAVNVACMTSERRGGRVVGAVKTLKQQVNDQFNYWLVV